MTSQRVLTPLLLTIPFAVHADTWRLDPPHSAAQFSVRHMGISTVRGTFTKLSGTVQYDVSDPSKSSMDITIDAASVDTRVEMRTRICAATVSSIPQSMGRSRLNQPTWRRQARANSKSMAI